MMTIDQTNYDLVITAHLS